MRFSAIEEIILSNEFKKNRFPSVNRLKLIAEACAVSRDDGYSRTLQSINEWFVEQRSKTIDPEQVNPNPINTPTRIELPLVPGFSFAIIDPQALVQNTTMPQNDDRAEIVQKLLMARSALTRRDYNKFSAEENEILKAQCCVNYYPSTDRKAELADECTRIRRLMPGCDSFYRSIKSIDIWFQCERKRFRRESGQPTNKVSQLTVSALSLMPENSNVPNFVHSTPQLPPLPVVPQHPQVDMQLQRPSPAFNSNRMFSVHGTQRENQALHPLSAYATSTNHQQAVAKARESIDSIAIEALNKGFLDRIRRL